MHNLAITSDPSVASSKPEAIIFDLYGTLLKFNQRFFLNEMHSAFQRNNNQNYRIELKRLLLKSYSFEDEMYQDWCNAFGIESPDANEISICRGIIQKHISEISPYCGVRTLLSFLRRKGIKLALLSNSAQIFTAPLKTLELEKYFDHISFSCTTGLPKPDTKAYLSVCKELGISPGQCLFIGDSYENDYLAPISVGMRAICLRHQSTEDQTIPTDLTQVALSSLNQSAIPLTHLIPYKIQIDALKSKTSVSRIEILPDDQQGRYNIIGRICLTDTNGEEQEYYCKRYLAPESAYVEKTAYQVMRFFGMTDLHVTLLSSYEPILLSSPAPGAKWTPADLDENSAEIIGTHCALAYLIGNADLRPRNTFIYRNGDSVTVSIIDLEHCFFDRALDLNDIKSPILPSTIDNLGSGIFQRTKHRVITPSSTSRSRKAFIPIENLNDPVVLRFRKGWVRIFNEAKSKVFEVEKFLIDRIYKEPFLIIGTQSYRRPMASIDVKDIVERMMEDGEKSFEIHYQS